MTYEDWCNHSKQILEEADTWNKWRRKAQHKLLTEIGPRIAKLDKSGYMGCGFHYGKEQTFSKLVGWLALPWQPCANHCGKIEDDISSNMITEVVYDGLIEDIEAAEKTVKKYKKILKPS
jgi:hypothetical protein